jgi:hypothetical protein
MVVNAGYVDCCGGWRASTILRAMRKRINQNSVLPHFSATNSL